MQNYTQNPLDCWKGNAIPARSSSYYTYRILAPFLILLCSDFFDFKSFEWAKFTFLVYLSHSLVLVMLEHFPVSNFGEGLLKWCVVFLICLLLSGGQRDPFRKYIVF